MDKEINEILIKRFCDMKTRCYNKKCKSYHSYWWRWIQVEWESFKDFYKDMWDSFIEHVEKYWIKNTTLDRIDVNWNYCKDNCRWATWEEQRNNKTTSRPVIYKWKRYNSITELSKLKWLDHRLVWDRLKRGWDIEDAVDKEIKDVSWTKIMWGWREYKSYRELSRFLWIPKDRISRWIRHWFTLEESIKLKTKSFRK